MTADEIRGRIDRLKAAIHSGVLTIQHGDTRTTFRNQSEMTEALRRLELDLAQAEGRPRRRRAHYVAYGGKGY